MIVLHFGKQEENVIEQTNGKCHMCTLTWRKTITSSIPQRAMLYVVM